VVNKGDTTTTIGAISPSPSVVGQSYNVPVTVAAVLLMYLWSLLLTGSGLAVGLIDGRLTVGLILLGLFGLFLVTALPRIAERRGPAEPRPPGSRHAGSVSSTPRG
jgi:hypothetical protein